MPPRRRPAKKNSTRMAAAVQNMAQMGFEGSLVKSTVRELLKLYTEDGWCFIEEHSYQVLREAFLEKTASPPQEEEHEPVLLQQQEGEGDGEIVVPESCVGSLHMAAADREIIELPSMPSDVFEELWSLLPIESDSDLDDDTSGRFGKTYQRRAKA